MYLLKKVIQLREHANQEEEKPFLEHLEDLRTMITRVVITLVISMLICLGFQERLMEVLRRPVERVWAMQLEEKLPNKNDDAVPISIETWGRAKAIERAATGLEAEQREALYRSLNDPQLAFHAKSASLLRAALALPTDRREEFINELHESPEMKKQVRFLMKTGPSPEVDVKGNITMMSSLKPTETFMLSMKLSFFAGIVLSFPLLLMFILQFILPGLHRHERKVMWPALAIGFGLFLGGVLFAYFAVLPGTLKFFYEWGGSMGVQNDWRIGEYISFATQFTLLFGVAFELPVVVMVMVKLDLLGYETMAKTRAYAIVAIFVAAAILTPTPDALTLCLMAAPMIVLYEICIWLAYFDMKKKRVLEAEEARQEEERAARRAEEREAEMEAERVARVQAEHEAAEASRVIPPAVSSLEGDTPDSGDDGWKPETPEEDDSDNWPIAPSYLDEPKEPKDDDKAH